MVTSGSLKNSSSTILHISLEHDVDVYVHDSIAFYSILLQEVNILETSSVAKTAVKILHNCTVCHMATTI